MKILIALLASVASLISAADVHHRITWEERTVVQSIHPGETIIRKVMIRANEDLGPLRLRASPHLSEYVTLSPTTIPALKSGESVELELIVHSEATSKPIGVRGLVKLVETRTKSSPWVQKRRAESEAGNKEVATYSNKSRKKSRVLGPPLRVRLQIVWPEFELSEGLSLSYPGTLRSEPTDDNSYVLFVPSDYEIPGDRFIRDWKPTVEYREFYEGNPGLPGDGVFISRCARTVNDGDCVDSVQRISRCVLCGNLVDKTDFSDQPKDIDPLDASAASLPTDIDSKRLLDQLEVS